MVSECILIETLPPMENTSEYSTGQPALSPDGNTLYFVSDKPGGKGMSDIYKVTVNKDGSLGTPQRLGDHINTEGKEVFPYVDSNSNLYFSSDGHMGIGGLDVFYAEVKGGNYGSPMNIGRDVNSPGDDFAFKFDPNTQEGYVSSDRDGGAGSDDLYQIKQLEELCDVTYNVSVINEYTKDPISGARVDLYDIYENRLSSKTSNPDGEATHLAECEKPNEVLAFAEGFESNGVTVDGESGGEVDVVIPLRPIEEIIVDDKVELNPILFDYDKHNIKPQAAFELDKLVAIMKKYPNMIIKVESHTDNRANDSYNVDLSNRRAQSTVQYVISKGVDSSRISGEGFGEERPVVDCGDNCTEEQHQKNRRSEFIIVER
jgi:outer membrane protein OmpA-like peptidoglycan-associated protein